MRVNIPKDMKVDLARKWLARNAPQTESSDESSTVTIKSYVEQAKNTMGHVIIIDDNETSSTSTTMIPIEIPVCDTRVSPEKLTLITSAIKVSLDSIYPMVQEGGHYKPTGCIPMHTVAIIVPYRNRTRNLTTFLYNIHPFLMTQNLEYRIFVIEQFGNNKFNKGRLFNAGFKEMKKYGSWRCVVFHDVDLLPMDRRIFYTCPQYPRHMSSKVLDRPSWRNASSPILFGGVTAMTLEHYERANGHSNMYWGWGGEDYDIFWRIRAAQIPIVRYNQTIARFLALPHPLAPENPLRYALIRSAVDRWQTEGLNTIDYKVISVEKRHLFTHILVDIAPWGEDGKAHDKIKPNVGTKKDIVKHRNREDKARWGDVRKF
ncbi:beta-1,4-N-acetylgalactosaminyltransferase bre-4 [Phthorimaea operculella]|nr:beta-1,4-N-acetylgalactosaminyltransferase bre-4 [Phthorimaea operculella]